MILTLQKKIHIEFATSTETTAIINHELKPPIHLKPLQTVQILHRNQLLKNPISLNQSRTLQVSEAILRALVLNLYLGALGIA